MKSFKASAVALSLLSATLFTGCTAMSYMTPANTSTTVIRETTYNNPHWAPPYYPGARYYYLPDIECYYDLTTDEFVYLYDGQWNYSRTVPYIYSNFDLDNCFTVVLSTEVYRPWLHHQYYASHYPRYYYSDYYDHSNIPYVRGFNENRKSAIYWGENDRHRARQWDDRNLRYDRRFKYQKEDRSKQKEYNSKNKDKYSDDYDKKDDREYDKKGNRDTDKNVNTRTQREKENAAKVAAEKAENSRTQREKTDAATEARSKDNTRTNRTATETGTRTRSTRQSETKTNETEKTQNTNYYGRTIGNPVKVDKQMQDKTEKATDRTTKTTTTRRR